MLFVFLVVFVLVSSITAAVATQRWAAQRRAHLSDERISALGNAGRDRQPDPDQP